MKKYDPTEPETCPKCLNDEQRYSYRPATEEFPTDCLKLTCTKCHYYWLEACADISEEDLEKLNLVKEIDSDDEDDTPVDIDPNIRKYNDTSPPWKTIMTQDN